MSNYYTDWFCAFVNTNTKITITVAGHQVEESQSERLLGIIVNNSLTWYNHLHGNVEHQGLIPKLSQRAGLVRKLSSLMPPERLRMIQWNPIQWNPNLW